MKQFMVRFKTPQIRTYDRYWKFEKFKVVWCSALLLMSGIYRNFFFWKRISWFLLQYQKQKGFDRRQRKQEREREREISGVNGNPPVLGIDPSIGSHIKLQLLDITLPLSACSDGLDKKCLPKRMLLQGRYGFPALWEQQPHACCLVRNFLPHRVNPGALSSYWSTKLL